MSINVENIVGKVVEVKKKNWSVLIRGIGIRIVKSKDIDGAYAAAMDEFDCKIDDILAVFSPSPIKIESGDNDRCNCR